MSNQVLAFLAEFKEIAQQEGLNVIPRLSHNTTVLNLGLTGAIVKEIILNLSHKHYFTGPLEDRDYPGTGELYTFRTKIDQVTIYIKLKIDCTKDGKKSAKCISFHE